MKKTCKILLVISLLIIVIYFAYVFIINVQTSMKVNEYIEKTSYIQNENTNQKDTKDIKRKINYTSILEIPSINLKEGLVDNTRNFNSIKYAVSIDNHSNYPNINGNFIVYAHSGNGRNAFFRNLVKVNLNEKVYVYYNGIKYEYEIIDKYDIEKTGKANVIITDKEKYITLITCNQSHKGYQVVLIGRQINQIKY